MIAGVPFHKLKTLHVIVCVSAGSVSGHARPGTVIQTRRYIYIYIYINIYINIYMPGTMGQRSHT